MFVMVGQITYSLEQLAQLFEQQGLGRLNARDAEIHIAFIQSKVTQLRKVAREIERKLLVHWRFDRIEPSPTQEVVQHLEMSRCQGSDFALGFEPAARAFGFQ